MLVSDRVSFPQEGQCVGYLGQLSGLTYLQFVGLIGVFDDRLPHVSGQGLVCVCHGQQFAAYPFFGYFLISVYSVIYIPGAFCQRLVGLLNRLYPLIVLVDGVAAQLGELP